MDHVLRPQLAVRTDWRQDSAKKDIGIMWPRRIELANILGIEKPWHVAVRSNRFTHNALLLTILGRNFHLINPPFDVKSICLWNLLSTRLTMQHMLNWISKCS